MYQAPRGTADILPSDQGYWDFIRRKAADICRLYGYQRIDTPTFEDARLFVRSIGEGTDIVEKEMYALEDRSGDRFILRPEGTAPVCRAYIEHGMHSLPQPVRLYYMASIFRYERPQAGRYREHHQFGVEAMGDADPSLDAEVIDVAWQFCLSLGLRRLSLCLNSIGCSICRPRYLDSLKAYYAQYRETLCPDCKRRIVRNPLRLLDCKNDSCVSLAARAPKSVEYLCTECAGHFDRVTSYLVALEVPFSFNHQLVRGLDYYNRTVFEIAPEGETAAQATIGGGGRYDNLIEQLGGRPTPAVGFGTGIERLVLNLEKQEVDILPGSAKPVFVAYLGEEAKVEAMRTLARMRSHDVAAVASFGDRSLKAQLKQANSTGSEYAVIIGEDEVRSRTAIVRDMTKGEQETVPMDALLEELGGRLLPG